MLSLLVDALSIVALECSVLLALRAVTARLVAPVSAVVVEVASPVAWDTLALKFSLTPSLSAS